MAEEWGYIAIEAPEEKNTVLKSDASKQAELFIECSGVELSTINLDVKGFEKIQRIGRYLVLDYDCSEWTDLSEKIFRRESEVEYFSWHGDEYGTKYYYSLSRGKEPIKVSFECDDDEYDVDLKIELGKWLESLPNELLDKCPEFNCLEEDDYISTKEAKTVDRSKPAPQLNLNCYFNPPVSKEELEAVLSPEFHEFNLDEDKDDGLFGLLDLFGVKSEKPKEPSPYSVFSWFPISEDRSRTVEELLAELSHIKRETIYAVNYFGHISFPYKVFKVDESGVAVIFDTNDFEEKHLDMLSEFKDPVVNAKVNWMSLDLDHVRQLDQEPGLKRHAEEQITSRLKKIEEFQRKDLQEHEAIWAAHSDTVEPNLKNVKYYLYYRRFDSDSVAELGYKLQKHGMRKVTIETGLGYSGKNTIVVSEPALKSAEWLRANIIELADHRVVVEEGSDAIIINMS